MTHTFKPTDTLVDVNQHILMNQGGLNQPFLLMTNFPKKIFSAADMSKTLKELGNEMWHVLNLYNYVRHSFPAGLLPSAVLIQTKP